MSDLDRMIKDSLDDMDKDSPELSVEPGYFNQAIGLFTGRLAWVNWLIMGMQIAMFVGGVWCSIELFNATETLAALKWGLTAAVLLIWSLITKMALVPHMETNRLLMEMKRMELRIERLRAEQR